MLAIFVVCEYRIGTIMVKAADNDMKLFAHVHQMNCQLLL